MSTFPNPAFNSLTANPTTLLSEHHLAQLSSETPGGESTTSYRGYQPYPSSAEAVRAW